MMIVGTFLPMIEIWNMDSENCEPIATLGRIHDNDKKVSKKLNKKSKINPEEIEDESHTDAVMSISLNPF